MMMVSSGKSVVVFNEFGAKYVSSVQSEERDSSLKVPMAGGQLFLPANKSLHSKEFMRMSTQNTSTESKVLYKLFHLVIDQIISH